MDGPPLVEHAKLLNNNTVSDLKSTEVVAYHVNTALVSFTYSFWRWLTEADHTAVQYLPVKWMVAKEVAGVSSEL